jgi:hypothetical protein
VLGRGDGDLPATAVMTANAGSRSFWVNILMDIMLFSNFSNVSTAQLDESMPAESSVTMLGERVDGGCVLIDLMGGWMWSKAAWTSVCSNWAAEDHQERFR